ncbi:MAG: peptidyl-prolyl cis-trans isomerase, partial [Candidatus Omnitrophica bacterium]|nr:peptidyl-prolyl cis-trans isomerase [Candidatus Omnitrophota bacterium]
AIMVMQAKQAAAGEVSSTDLAAIEKTVLDNLIVNKLIMQEAKSFNVEVSDAEIEERLNEVKKKFVSEDELKKGLGESGIGIEDLKESYRYEITMRKLFMDNARQSIVLAPQEVKDYYEKNKSDFMEPDKVKVRNIFIGKDKKSPDEISARLQNISSLVKEGSDFKGLAIKLSEGANAFTGGDMGDITRGELSSGVESIIFNLNPGQVSDWIETDSGFYLFKIEEKIPAQQSEFSEAQGAAKNALYNQKMNDKLNNWIAKLKGKAFINIYE